MPRMPFRARLRLAAGTSLAALAALTGCTIEEPSLPSYETEWLVPLGDYEKTLREIIEDEPDFVIGSDGTISLTSSGEIDAIGVGDRLDLEVDGISFQAEIGTVHLDPTAPIGFDNELRELYPAADAFHGATVPVPAFTFDLAGDAQDIPGFRTATLASGGIDVEVVNGLPVPVGATFGSNQLRIDLLDPSTGQNVLPQTFVVDEEIPAGSTYLRTIDLAGRTLPDFVEVRLTGGSPGSVQPVTIDAGSRLAVRVATTALEVESAEAEFGAQSFADTSVVALPDSIRVQEAVVDRGVLQFRVRNDLPIDATAVIRIEAFETPAGEPLVFTLPLVASTNSVQMHDLADHVLRLDPRDPEPTFDVVANVTTPGSEGATVSIAASDVISVDVEPMPLVFRTVTGVVDAIAIDLEPSTSEIEIPDDLDDLQLQRATLTLGFDTSLGLPLGIDLRIEGTNADGVMVPLDASIEIPGVSGNGSSLVNVVLDESNSGIVDFLNNLPESIVFSGRAFIGDGVTVGTVAATDSVSARWSIAAPMTVALLAQTINGDAEALDLDEDARADLDERLLGLTLEADVTSTLPIEAVAYIGIAADSTRAFTDPDLELGPITIPAAGPARPDGRRDGVHARSTVLVEEKDVSVVTQPGTWQGVRVVLPGTNGQFVTLRATDRIEVRGFLRARVLIGEVRR